MDASADATTSGDRFRGQVLLLRGRAGLTQGVLASYLGISEQAIQKWEAGQGYPSLACLQALIALYLERGVFTAGHEAAEAAALWEAASGQILAILQGDTGVVRGVALRGDGHIVASDDDDEPVKLWDVGSGASLRMLRSDRHYERLDITGLTGVNAAQRADLLALGALDEETAPGMAVIPAQVASR
jgi:DNA-binding XRE family transcriptional regulator